MSASKFLVFCSVAVLVSLPALAWDNTNTGPGPKSIADGGPSQAQQATAAARSTAIQRTSQRVIVNTASSSTNSSRNGSSGASDPAAAGYGRGYGGGHQEPAATAYAPSFGSANPCVGRSASLGAQFQLFGLSAGGQQFDYGCAAERIGNMQTIGQKLDFAFQCRDDSRFRQSAYDIGMPCPADQERFQQEHVTAQFVSASAPVQARAVPDWCLTASLAERRRHPACNQ